MLKEKNPLSRLGNIDHIHNRIRYGNIKERLVQSSSSSDIEYYYDNYQYNTNTTLNCKKRHLVMLSMLVGVIWIDQPAYTDEMRSIHDK